MKNTTVAASAKADNPAPLYTPVHVAITYDASLEPPVVITVEKKYQEDETNGPVDPANMQLGNGHWEVHFELDPDSGLVFRKGPVLIGIEDPQISVENPIAFGVTRGSDMLRVLRFEFPEDCGPTFQYAIRVMEEESGKAHLIDPKVINRGEPAPVPPLLKD